MKSKLFSLKVVAVVLAISVCCSCLIVLHGQNKAAFLNSKPSQLMNLSSAALPENVATVEDFVHIKEGYRNAYEKLMAEDGFVYGMDYFVFGTNNDGPWALGYNEFYNSEPVFDEYVVQNDFYNIKALGFNAVNFWLMYSLCGIKFDHTTGYASGLDQTFLQNLVKALEAARAVDLKVVVSLQPQSSFPNPIGSMKEGYSKESLTQKYLQFYWRDEARDAYMKNVIKPLCEEVLQYYQDTIIICDITVENGSDWIDDDEIGRSQFGNGTTSENMERFVTDVNTTIKSVMPDTMTSTEDITLRDCGWHWNDTGIDLHGINMYNDYGSLHSVAEYYSNTPIYVGECNLAHSYEGNANLSSWENNQILFFKEAKNKGYIGAFHFSWSTGGGFYTMFTGNSLQYETMRPLALKFNALLNDMKNEYNETEGTPDKPVLLSNAGGNNVYWVGGRTMTRFKLERSLDGGKTWTVISSKLADGENGCKMLTNGLYTYNDSAVGEGDSFNYRVTAYNDEEGISSVSEPNNVAEYFVPPELVIDGGFESVDSITDYPSVSKAQLQANTGWARTNGNVAVISSDMAYEGKNSLFVDLPNGIGQSNYAELSQKLVLTPGKTYSVTAQSYMPNFTGPLTLAVYAYDGDTKYLNGGFLEESTEDWTPLSFTFSAPSHGTVILMVTIGTNRQPTGYLDNISLKEIR